MKSLLKNLLTICLVAFVISSCSNKNADLLIPKDAGMVMHINAASLSSKLSWDEIKNSDWFRISESTEPKTQFEKKLFEDPENTGLDLKSDIYFFLKKNKNLFYVTVQGKIKDMKKYEAMLKETDKDREIKKDGEINFSGDKDAYYTWTNDRFIIVSSITNPGARNIYNPSDTKENAPGDSLLKYAKDLYHLKQSNSLASDSRFSSIMNEKGDFHLWINNGELLGNEMMRQLSFIKASSVFEGNSTGVTINFENGKITGTSKAFYNKELRDTYDKFYSGNLNTDMLKKIPGNDVSVVVALNYKPEGIRAFLKLLGFDGLVDGYLSKANLSLDDIINANKGDLMFAVSDFKFESKPEGEDASNNYNDHSRPEAKVLVATSINNKAAFDKIIDAVKSTVSKEGLNNSNVLPPVKYEIKDNWFVAGNSQENVSAYGASSTDHPFISKISGHPFGAYINLKRMLSGIDMSKMVRMYALSSSQINSLVGVWDDIVMYGGEMKDGAATSYFEINMTDKNMNSLKQLNNFIGSVATIFMRPSSAAWDNEMPMVDTTMPARPVITEH